VWRGDAGPGGAAWQNHAMVRKDEDVTPAIRRCAWCGDDPVYVAYHDQEWGYPVAEERRLFEKICLEGFQAGLSWRTILMKREAFRKGFAGFDIDRIARFGARDIARLLGDAGIVRHRGKIASTINNAQRARETRAEFGSLAAYFWQYEPPETERPRRVTPVVLATMATSAQSIALSKDLKKRGYTFVGPTTVYAFMQAMGLVNDHVDRCIARAAVTAARASFRSPVRALPAASQTSPNPRRPSP